MVEPCEVVSVDASRRICLHVGCGPRDPAALHPMFRGAEWRELRVDIDPQVEPDIVASITDLKMIATGSVDAVWSSHNLEHLYPHEVQLALDEFNRVLKGEGIVLITLPDLQKVAELVAADRLEDVAYVSPAGPITPLDMLYGHRGYIRAGKHFMAHHTGFTARTLGDSLSRAGFEAIQLERADFSLWAQAQKPWTTLPATQKFAGSESQRPSAATCLEEGIRQHTAGHLANAERLYRQVLQEVPAHADALHLLGVIAFQQGDATLAVRMIKQAIAINPQSEAFYSNLGAVYQETGDYDEALASYRRALELKPDLAEAHNNLGNVFKARNELELAIQCYRKALTLKPEMFEALNNLGTVCGE